MPLGWGLLTHMRLITSSRTDRSDIDKKRKAEGLENHALYLLGGRNNGMYKVKSSCHTAGIPPFAAPVHF